MSKQISKKLAAAIQEELVKFDGTHSDFIDAVHKAATDKTAAKTTVDLAHQFIILGTYFHKIAGQPLSDTPNYGTEFQVSVAGNVIVSASLSEGEIHVMTHGNLEFLTGGNKAAHIIKKWEQRITQMRRDEMRRHKDRLKELSRMLPKKQAKAKKASTNKSAPGKAAPAEDGDW